MNCGISTIAAHCIFVNRHFWDNTTPLFLQRLLRQHLLEMGPFTTSAAFFIVCIDSLSYLLIFLQLLSKLLTRQPSRTLWGKPRSMRHSQTSRSIHKQLPPSGFLPFQDYLQTCAFYHMFNNIFESSLFPFFNAWIPPSDINGKAFNSVHLISTCSRNAY